MAEIKLMPKYTVPLPQSLSHLGNFKAYSVPSSGTEKTPMPHAIRAQFLSYILGFRRMFAEFGYSSNEIANARPLMQGSSFHRPPP
jgi:hypothetical protein